MMWIANELLSPEPAVPGSSVVAPPDELQAISESASTRPERRLAVRRVRTASLEGTTAKSREAADQLRGSRIN